MSLLSLSGVVYRYLPGRKPALESVDMEVPEDAVTVLLGPNGSGKTTLLHVLLGLLEPERGSVRLEGRPWREWSRQERSRRVCLVPQFEPISFDLAVEEYVLLGRAPFLGLLQRPGPDDRRAARRALADAGALSLAERSVRALSGGERQLVTVARALAQQARVVLMDEPTSHLDLANTQRVLELARGIAAGGRAVVLTTHDPNAALAVGDQAVLLREGGVAASGPARQVLTDEALSETYGVPVRLVAAGDRRLAVVDPS